jgi:HTH domain/WYL domain
LLVRADRLLSLALLLQARGVATARTLAAELGVSVRTVYRDLEALGAAGVPVVTEPGPGGGCRLMDGYRFPLRGLRADEAEALLILGVPAVLRDLGLAGAGGRDTRVFRAGRVSTARVLPEPFERPAGFELAAFWARWSAEFEASRPRLQVGNRGPRLGQVAHAGSLTRRNAPARAGIRGTGRRAA